MWVVRELVRLLTRIGLAALIALVLAEVRALATGGELLHGFQISCYVMGALLFMLGAMGSGSNYERRLQLSERVNTRYLGIPMAMGARPGDPPCHPARFSSAPRSSSSFSATSPEPRFETRSAETGPR